jgi:predicted nuclease of predicted toxin-antitoxin system
MNLLLDHNLSARLVRSLSDDFPGVAHVGQFGLERADDRAVWEFAKEQGYAIVSEDSDFRQMSFLSGSPPKVIWLRLGNCTTGQIEACLRRRVEDVRRFLADREASFLVLDG